MTPQLMQAIKLLQLSNLDLAAYVEGELERIPCWSAPPRASRAPSKARRSRRRGVRRRRSTAAEADGPADRIDEDLETSRSAIEERLGTDLENVFPTTRSQRRSARPPTQPRGLFRMGRRRQRRARGRRLQSRSLRLGRADARRSSRRAAGAGDRRSGPAHDRAVPDRSGRRGRLSHRRSRAGRREARRAAGRGRSGAGDAAGVRSAGRVRAQSHRMPRDPAQGAQPLRSGDAGAGRPARSAGQARSRRRCGASAASATRTSPT